MSLSKNSNERLELEHIIRDNDKWDEFAQLDTAAINKIIQEKSWDDEILGILKEFVKLDESKRLYLSKIRNE